jgi:hypothetical protein
MAPRKAKPPELPEVIEISVTDDSPIAQILAVPKLHPHPSPSPSPKVIPSGSFLEAPSPSPKPAPSSHGPIVPIAVAVAVFFGLLGGRE